MNKILLIEDDEAIRTTLKEILTSHNFLVETASDGAMGFDMLKKSPPDLLLLDLGLPVITGESLCKEAHKKYPNLPIIILTAKNQSENIVNGLTIGAIDYVSKPFEVEELIARIKAHLRGTEQEVWQVDDLTLNTTTLEVTRSGKPIALTPHEFKLLQYLLMNKGRVVTREMILDRVWQYSYNVDTRVVDVYIGYLRKKIDAQAKKKLISSIRGFGYSIKE